MDHLVLFNIVSKFADLGENILRVEHRLYPDMFPDQKFLEIEKPKPIEKEALIIKIQNPFSSISDKFEDIRQKATEIMKNEGIENEEIVKISMDLKLLRSEVFKTKRKIFTDLISLDFDPFANSILEKIKILEDSINVKVNEVISSESKKITDYYSISSKKLYGKNVFDQLHNLATVTNVDIPKVKSMFEHLFQKNSILMENFDLTELTILQYYQASRAFRRLTYLSDLIWEKLQVDRKKIEKSVIEKSSAIFYEAEMLERELKLCIKKYKLFKIPNQVKQLNSRFSEISLNLEKLAEEYPVLNNQLILLSMEPISIDIPFLFHQSKIFAQVSSLHVDTIACEEIYMDNGLAKETLDQLLPKIQQVVKTFSETLPMCESKVSHLEPLFTAEDIAYQMPEEWRMFQIAHEKWKALHIRLLSTKLYIELVSMDFQSEFDSVFSMFKRIQTGFDAYLQKRKLNSPRLHFLSNTELLELLSRARNPELVEPYLPKLFSSISKPEFNNRGEIVAVFSDDGERFEFRRPVNVNLAKRHVDKWILELEREMRNTLKFMIRNVLQKYGYRIMELDKMIQQGFIGQVILIHYRLAFTHNIESAILNGSLRTLNADLTTFSSKLKRFRSSNSRERLLLDNLLIELEDIQSTIDFLVNSEVHSIEHWAWTSQFRFYWSNENMFIRILNFSVLYGYEYLSVTKPFVKTPKIKELNVNLVVHQQNFFACLLQGPAATGKSETIKEISKVLGKFCVPFNCSPQISIEKIENLISGALLSGTNLCLDEFNRLSSDVMASAINHLIAIYQSMESGRFRYKMNGLELIVNSMAAFYLSMNPGYVGRNPLPSNTTSVAKIIDVEGADLEAIAQEYFLLAKFKDSKKCASQLTTTFSQCSATVSPMRHYDFHLRTVLGTVKNAIWLRDSEKGFPEDVITIKAVQNLLSSMFTDIKLVEEIHGGEERWIHIDGVIDSLWVESLNSLLDDNRKLNLGNGETIILNPQIRILFETDDLSKIALSTVSRCRVIYFDDNLIDPSVIGSSIDEGILEESIEKCRILKLSSEETKPVFFRMSELYKIHDAFPKNDPQLGKLLFEISKMSVLDEEEFDENSSDEQNPENENRKLFSTFPQAFGQWMDLSTEKQPGVRFWRMFLKRILRSSLMLVVYGESGTGKTKFITDLVSTLNHEHWEIHVLSLSEETTSTSLLQSILDCNLVRIHSNHFTGPNAKNVLIILDGLSRLSMGKSFDCGIISNLDKWTNSEFVSFTILELKKSNFFTKAQIQEFSLNLIELFEYIQKKFPEISSLKYLSFVKQFIHIVKEKKTSLDLLEKRYKTGISKLLKANEQMNFLQQELLRLQPELVRTSLETTVLMSQIERETIEIENAREVVAANEFKANEAATKAQSLKADCEQQVAEAIPALETAIDALQILNQSDISTLKTMRFPPQGVRMCMEAVCILLNEKPIKTADPLGNVTVDYWTPSQKILSDIHFLGRIRNFPRDKVSEKTMRLIRNKYLSKPEFDPESMKQVSLAAEGLCLWIKALDIYNKIAKVVEPKKEKLKKAELMVKQHMKQLEQRRKALQEVTERLQKLSDQFSHMGQRKQDLQNQIQGCELKIRRAEKLLEALGTEKERTEHDFDQLPSKLLEKVCIINVAVGENIIRDQLMEIFLQVNALSLTEKRDQLASEKNNLIKKTDFLEETILDALAKSKDLDDDKTIDMLEEVRNSTKLLQEKMTELDEIEEQLRFLKNKFIKIGNYGTRLVNASLTISKFSSFYSRTLRFFLQVFRKAVAVENDQFNVENIEFINMKVSSAFRHKFARSLFARDRKLFDLFCLEQISLKNISQLTEKNFIRLFSTIPLEKLSNLRDQILHADPGLPIVLLLSSESNYVIRMLFSLADHFLPEKEGSGSDQNPKKNVQLFSAADLPESDWKTFLQQDQWLIVQNCENLKTDQMERLRETCKSIFKDESRKANFRLFLILYPDGELLIAKWIFLGINKHDDRILDEIKSMSFEDPGNISIKNSINRMRFLIDGMRPIKEGLLSGLSSSVVENYKNIELLKIYKNLKKMENKKEGGKFIFEMTISKSPEEAEGASALEKCVLNEIQFLKENDILPERQSILKSLLISKPLRKFCLYHFERPESLIETLKFIYARKYKILLEEIQIVGSLNFSESFVDESGFIDGFELLDCFLLGAGIDEKSKKVIESSRPLVKIKSLYLLARRKSTKSRTGFCLPFFYKSTLNSSKWREIAEIEVESSLPENHWLLRGVKFVTFENNEEFSSF
ncbi:hypothetical protein FO519_002498 [Halicephalobus sp. NKZ332]|nr:hypothetical protein FO519_002498 [Halicephalobus sp. NKZ332]